MIQHLWRYVDEEHPRYEMSQYSRMVREYHQRIDEIIGLFLDGVPKDTLVFLLSDHGFCPVHTEVVLNNYMEELG